MDFGVQINGSTFEKLRGHVQKAEELGYATVWMPDHFIYESPGGAFDPNQPVFEQVSMLCGLAEATSTIRLGTHVLCTLFRHPALTAKILTTLDHISNGRLLAGFGAGWTKQEFDMMGIDFPDVSTRLRIMDEHVQVVRALWTEERTTFDGEFYQIADAVCAPKPVQRPHPPILLGGNGNGIMRRAGRFADMVNIVVSLGKEGTMDLAAVARLTSDAFKKKIAVVREEQEKAGRPKDAVRVSTTMFQFMPTDSPDTTKAIHENLAGMYGMPPEEVAHMPMALIGTPDQMLEEMRWREQEWELDHVIVNAQNSHEMRTFGEQIIAAY